MALEGHTLISTNIEEKCLQSNLSFVFFHTRLQRYIPWRIEKQIISALDAKRYRNLNTNLQHNIFFFSFFFYIYKKQASGKMLHRAKICKTMFRILTKTIFLRRRVTPIKPYLEIKAEIFWILFTNHKLVKQPSSTLASSKDMWTSVPRIFSNGYTAWEILEVEVRKTVNPSSQERLL